MVDSIRMAGSFRRRHETGPVLFAPGHRVEVCCRFGKMWAPGTVMEALRNHAGDSIRSVLYDTGEVEDNVFLDDIRDLSQLGDPRAVGTRVPQVGDAVRAPRRRDPTRPGVGLVVGVRRGGIGSELGTNKGLLLDVEFGGEAALEEGVLLADLLALYPAPSPASSVAAEGRASATFASSDGANRRLGEASSFSTACSAPAVGADAPLGLPVEHCGMQAAADRLIASFRAPIRSILKDQGDGRHGTGAEETLSGDSEAPDPAAGSKQTGGHSRAGSKSF